MAAKTLNYQSLLGKDPILQSTLSAISGQGVDQQGALTQARQQALIGYGAIPGSVTSPALSSLLGGIAPDITQTTRDLAQSSTDSGLSTLAQLRQGYTHDQGASTADLGGRGLLRSGAYAQHAGENLQNLQTGEANAQTGLLGQLSGLWSGYQGQQQQNASQAQSATSDALTRIMGQINAGIIGTSPTNTPAPAAAPSNFTPGSNAGQVAKNTTGYGVRPVPVIPRSTAAATGAGKPLY